MRKFLTTCAAVVLLLVLIVPGGSVQAATRTKLNNTTDLDTAGSWSGGVPGTADIALWNSTVTGPNTVVLGGNLTIGQIRITNPGGLVTIGAGDTLTLSAGAGSTTGIDMSSATANLTINSLITISASQVWNVGGTAILTVAGNVNDSTTQGLTKDGTGTLILSGVNSYDGATIVNAGLVVISGNNGNLDSSTTVNGGTLRATTSANALGDGSSGNLVTLAGGALELANNTGLTFGRDTTVSGNTTVRSDRLTSGAGVTHTMGTLSIGAQTLTVERGAFVTSGTAGIAFGATTLSASGTIFDVASGASLTLASVAPSAAAQRNITVQGAGNTTISGAITTSSGTSTLTKNGTGTLTLNGANTFTGDTTVNDGVLRAANSTALGTTAGNTVVNAGAIELTGGITIAAGEELFVNGTGISDDGALLNLSGDNTWAGDISFGSDARINSDSGTLTLSGAMSGNFAKTFGGAGNITKTTSAITGSGSLTYDGTGTLTLGVNNTYTGKTIISSGTVSIGDEAGLGNNPVTFVTDQLTLNGGTLAASASLAINDANRGITIGVSGGTFSTPTALTTLTISNPTTGTGSLTKSGPGTLMLSGNNNYSGVTMINTGILKLGSATALGTTAGHTVVSASGAALDLNGQTVGNEALEITGTGISSAGALINSSVTAASLAGDVNNTLGDAGVFSIGGTGEITLTGNVRGTITKVGPNTLTLGGTVDNVGVGVTVTAGTMVLAKTSHSGVHAIGGAGLTIGGGTVKLGGTGDDQIYDHSWVTVNTGTLDFNGRSETFDVLAGTGGTILNNGGGARVLTIGSGGGTYAGVIANRTSGSGTLALVKSGTGTEIFSGVNTYTGATTLKGGVLRLDNAASLPGGLGTSGGTSALTFNGGVLGIGAATNFVRGLGTGSSQVQWTGSGGFAAYGGARTVNLGGSAATVTWNSGGFVPTSSALVLGASDADNTLTFQNPINFNGAVRTVQAHNGSASTDAILSGILSNGGLTKTGTGTLELTANNTYAGTTTVDAGTLGVSGVNGDIAQSASVTINSGATLRLSNTSAANNGDRIGSVGITMNGGIFEFDHPADGVAYSETVGALTLSSGASTIISDAAAGTGSSSILTFGALSRSVGATVNFSGSPSDDNDNNNVVFSGLANANGIIGGWATVGTNWASWQTGNDSVEALGAYQTSTTIANWTTTTNVSINANPSANLDTRSINSLRLNDNTGSQTVTLNSGQTLTLTSGGLMATDNATKTITGGTLQGAAGADLVVIQSGGNLSINSVIANNTSATALTKSGTGTLILGGNNTYTGGLYVNQGVVQLNNDEALNSTTPNAVTVNSPGTLSLNGNSVTVAGLAGAGTVQNNHASTAATLTVNKASGTDTFSGVIQDGGAAVLALNKTGDGTLVLSGANTFTGGTILSAGAITLGAANALGTGDLEFAGGTINANNQQVNMGVLTLSADSTLNLASGGSPGSSTFAGATWEGGFLTITGWSGIEEIGSDDDGIIFWTAPSQDFLDHVLFQLDSGLFFASLTGSNEVVPGLTPVPEPTEWALIIFAVMAVLYKFAWPRLRLALPRE